MFVKRGGKSREKTSRLTTKTRELPFPEKEKVKKKKKGKEGRDKEDTSVIL